MILVKIKEKVNLNVSIFFFLEITLDISGNKADTNLDKESVLGDLYLGLALLYKKLNLNKWKIKCFQTKKVDQGVLEKIKFKKLKTPKANKLRKPIYYFFKSQSLKTIILVFQREKGGSVFGAGWLKLINTESE